MVVSIKREKNAYWAEIVGLKDSAVYAPSLAEAVGLLILKKLPMFDVHITGQLELLKDVCQPVVPPPAEEPDAVTGTA